MAGEPGLDVAAAHRHFSAACFNMTWDYLDKTDRTAEDDQRMIETSLASIWHWTQREDCTDTNLSVGYWQASRVYSTVGMGDEARRYGGLCLRFSQAEGVGPFYLGYAYEALARAEQGAGNRENMEKYLAEARAAAEKVQDADSKGALLADLSTIT